jgi:hypothetical protein
MEYLFRKFKTGLLIIDYLIQNGLFITKELIGSNWDIDIRSYPFLIDKRSKGLKPL